MADPIGISGFLLSLPGLIIACADLYQLTVKAGSLNRDVNILIYRVGLEQAKFGYWLEEVGFIEGSKPTLKLPPVAQKSLAHLLQCIKDTLVPLLELINEYEVTASDDFKAGNLALPEHFWRLRMREPPKSTDSRLIAKIFKSGTRPLTWAAAQQERADKLMSDLKSFNEDLGFISTKLSTKSSMLLPARILSHVWSDENLQTFIDATAQHEPDLAQCAQFKRDVLAVTREALLAAQRLGTATKASALRLLPPRISKRRKTQLSHLVAAEYSDKARGTSEPVLLEEKSFASGPSPQYEKFIETRISEVAAILSKTPKPAGLRVFDCIGYVRNMQEKSFSFVFSYPKDVESNVDSISLQKLFPPGPNAWLKLRTRGANSATLVGKASLRDRFAMALSLCQSIALLQACGVLHKGIAPSNILFFQRKGVAVPHSSPYDLSRPFISGFSWARLHGSDYVSDPVPSNSFASTSGLLHVHPAYMFNDGQRYLKAFDLYSLGVVLLQIGLWRALADIADELFPSLKSNMNKVGFNLDEALRSGPLDEWFETNVASWQGLLLARQQVIAHSDGIASTSNPRRSFQEALVENLQRLLVPEMGETYTRVVARCLTGDFENDGLAQKILDTVSDENEPEYVLQDAIVKRIVKELEKCNA